MRLLLACSEALLSNARCRGMGSLGSSPSSFLHLKSCSPVEAIGPSWGILTAVATQRKALLPCAFHAERLSSISSRGQGVGGEGAGGRGARDVDVGAAACSSICSSSSSSLRNGSTWVGESLPGAAWGRMMHLKAALFDGVASSERRRRRDGRRGGRGVLLTKMSAADSDLRSEHALSEEREGSLAEEGGAANHAAAAAAAAAVRAPAKGGRRRRTRLDEACLRQHPEFSRSVIQSWILQGKVLVNGRPVTKCGAAVASDAALTITAEVPRFVSRAGQKLEAALEHFQLPVAGLVALDSGLSTGGFTDCLLQRGAEKVFGVDVGYGQVAERIRTDERVVVMERTNLRHLKPSDISGMVDIVTLDLSFISVLLVLPAICGVLKKGGALVILIKPQFEAKKGQVGGGGIVRNAAVHEEVVARIVAGTKSFGFQCLGVIQSPVTGTDGNVEFLGAFEFVSPVDAVHVNNVHEANEE